jgi:hypothetical protein
MVRAFACCLALAVLAGPVSACINDSELPHHEREFRSQYTRKASPPMRTPPAPMARWPLVVAGGSMLASAAVVLVGARARG